MEGRNGAGAPIVFSSFEVDVAKAELRKHGALIRLSGQPFQILLALLEQPGELVSREQLRSLIWPKDTFVDFEGGLNSAIAKLRRALGDSAESPRYIETITGVGYRFIGTLKKPPEAILPEAPVKAPASAPLRSKLWIVRRVWCAWPAVGC